MSTAPTLLEKWVAAGLIKCPRCGSVELELSDVEVCCGACASGWPVRNRVADFFNGYANSAASGPGAGQLEPVADPAVVDRVMRTLGLSADDATTWAVSDIIRRSMNWRCDDPALAAEIHELVDRFEPRAGSVSLPPIAAGANEDASISYERHYFNDSYAVGEPLCANVRVRNQGTHAWSSRSMPPRVLAAWWQRADQQLSGEAEPQGTTRFPIDLSPGVAITLPLQLTAPEQPGQWVLLVGLCDGGKVLPDAARLEVVLQTVAREQQVALRGTEIDSADVWPDKVMDYGEDHAAAREMVEQWVRAQGRSDLRLLELGAGVHPQTAWQDGLEVLALDISSPLLELGSLYFGNRFTERLAFVCADGFAPPLVPGSLDAVAMFSALHHFPAPDELLGKVAALLRPQGVVFVMCEPVGTSLEARETVRDLAKGINEQVFSLEEYRLIFRRAGLAPRLLRVDGTSLKAVLQLA